MFGGSFGIRLALTAVVGVVMLGFGLVLRDYQTIDTDPFLSTRGWWALIGVGAVALLVTVFTVPFSRGGMVLHLFSYTVFVLAFVRTVRGLSRVSFFLPVVTGDVVSGPARPAGGSVRAPFSGQPCLTCTWRLERSVDAPRDDDLFETVSTGVVGDRINVSGRSFGTANETIVGGQEGTVDAEDWADGWRNDIDSGDHPSELTEDRYRAIERRIEDGDPVTVLPRGIYLGDSAAARRTLLRSLVTRVVAGSAVAVLAVAGVVLTAFS